MTRLNGAIKSNIRRGGLTTANAQMIVSARNETTTLVFAVMPTVGDLCYYRI